MIEHVIQLIAAAALMYLVSEWSKVEGTEGYTFSLYPWITTLPETITTVMLALSGYYVAALYNSVFSAVFDLAVGLGIVALLYGPVEFRIVDLVGIAAASALVFCITDIDGIITFGEGLMLYAVLFFAIAYSIARYGLLKRRATHEDIFKTVVGLVLLAMLGFWYYMNVEALIPYLGEKLGGIVSAVLTSLPDVVVAAVYGLMESEAQAELVGAIMHDFVENVPTAAIVVGLFGGYIVDSNPMLTIAAAAVTASTLVFVASYRRVTKFEGIVLLLLFLICAYLAVV